MSVLMPNVRIVPPAGTCKAVICDVIDQQGVETQFGIKDKVRFVFELDVENNGKRMFISRSFNESIHPKASLRIFVEGMLGRRLNDQKIEAAGGFDPSALVGTSCHLALIHAQGQDGQTYANITAATPLPAGTAPLTVRDYRRKAA
jgi:hypothetical protein